jgi:hypothetical protein
MTCDHALEALLAPLYEWVIDVSRWTHGSLHGCSRRHRATHAPTCVSQIANAIADEMYLRLCLENCDRCMSLSTLWIQRRMIADVQSE